MGAKPYDALMTPVCRNVLAIVRGALAGNPTCLPR